MCQSFVSVIYVLSHCCFFLLFCVAIVLSYPAYCFLLILYYTFLWFGFFFFFFKQKTAYEMRISDWSSDVCSSDLRLGESPKLLRSNNIVQGGHHGGVILRQAGLNRCLVGAPGGDLFGGAVGRRCPDSFWKMAIPRPARNYMPVKMRHHIAELRQIDLVGAQDVALRLFNPPDRVHKCLPGGGRQLSHFGNVFLPYHPGKARMHGVIHVDDAQQRVAPEQLAAGGRDRKSTRLNSSH